MPTSTAVQFLPVTDDDFDALTALRGSESNAFYLRCGFVQTGEEEWDIHYEYRR
ncbi:GnaT family acetyltransferase [Bordetella ansorpii]|uniref:GnaT family acetyltransferase n=1 Tax=Bordetella ansorpii TaxID=288768 RepID=A0A157SI20_9BORD|nr:GnaT family acetyltransferase [Bordetella ansorpii]